MNAKPIDLTKILRGVGPGWAAISSDYKRLVAKGKNFKEINKKVEGMPHGSVVLMPVVKNFRNIVTICK